MDSVQTKTSDASTSAGATPSAGEALGADFYERYGEQWSSTSRREMERHDTAHKVRLLCEMLSGLKIERVMDFGCGLGDALELLSRHFAATQAVGIDVSSTMLAYAREQYPEHVFLHGGIEDMQRFPVDVISFIDVLEHLEDIPATLEVAKRNAQYLAIKIPLERTWLMDLMQRLGLKDERSLNFESEGHLYEFDRAAVDRLLADAGLETLDARVDLYMPHELLFGESTRLRMKSKPGLLARLKYAAHLLLGALPDGIARFWFRAYHGDDYYVVCRCPRPQSAPRSLAEA